LFEIIGKACTARGVFTAEQLPDAMARLRQAVTAEKEAVARPQEALPTENKADGESPDDAEQSKSSVSLGQRAHPVIRLMERTQKEGGFILWEAAEDF
jgi:Sec-independent protein translocase protein TatA